MDFARYLKQLREKNNLSIRQLALYSNVSAGYLSQIESGIRGIPSPTILKKISIPLKISYEELMKAAGYLTNEKNAQYKLSVEEVEDNDGNQSLVNKFSRALQEPINELFFDYVLNISQKEREEMIGEFLKIRSKINMKN